ncbi:MAG: hypothetical protein JOY90_21750 [Bradyrhizobium sp.]|uniref:hypothetical protein n=1 Tax=Bradyrhizobium sp. TaxID=376 RepID=UPI001DB5926A|nr:hypothetical protein [Bradyrhizobium sp.]MBV9563042.1 hypothetical protein [Bradyrhizobium sp.]
MRTVSLILALVLVLAGSSMAGSAEGGLPGAGTFAYGGPPVAATQAVIVAAR